MFDLIEYAMDIDLPDFVVSHPIIKALNQGANDLVTVCSPSRVYLISLLTHPSYSGVTSVSIGGCWSYLGCLLFQ